MSAREPFESRWNAIRDQIEIADIGFFLLRIIALAGSLGWVLFAGMSEDSARAFLRISVYFIAYNLVLYLFLYLVLSFRASHRKKLLYAISLAFDLSFVSLLVVNSGGFDSGFFIGYYVLAALHAFYYGLPCGLYAAAACAAGYGLASFYVLPPGWVEFSLRAAFFFLIALPIGFFSTRMRRDQKRIMSLNRELLASLDELRRLQDKVIQAEKLSALGRLTSDVAHEIRNPLTVVGGYARRLAKRIPEGVEEKKYVQIIVSEVGRLERILKDTLNFSREAKYHLSHTNIGDLLPGIAEAFADLCREKGVTLVVDPAPVLPACIIDKDQVRQAAHNLVANALDAMPSGGTLTLRTRTGRDNGGKYVILDVIDTGVGIPEDQVGRIFDPFYTTKEIGHGTGLGLSICKKIMDEHKGSIRVKSAPGKGSTFSLYIPYLSSEEAFWVQCWEYVHCGMEKVKEGGKRCPAYPNYGRMCWLVAGSFAEEMARCERAQELGDCRKCEFYDRVQVRQDL